MTAIQRKVTKEGPNTGRSFWTCPNPEGSRCGYFEWDDAGPEDGLPSGGMMAGAGGGQSGECYKVSISSILSEPSYSGWRNSVTKKDIGLAVRCSGFRVRACCLCHSIF